MPYNSKKFSLLLQKEIEYYDKFIPEKLFSLYKQNYLREIRWLLSNDPITLKEIFKKKMDENPNIEESLEYLIGIKNESLEIELDPTDSSTCNTIIDLLEKISVLIFQKRILETSESKLFDVMLEMKYLERLVQLKKILDSIKVGLKIEIKKSDEITQDEILMFSYLFFQFGHEAGRLKQLEVLMDDPIKDLIHAQKAAKAIGKTRWAKINKLKEEAEKIAEKRYEAGYRGFHNEIANDIYLEFKSRFEEKYPQLLDTERSKKYPSKKIIIDVVKPIADRYGCVRGKKGVTKKS